MSLEELRVKRNSVLKHQSQMENAPFLGNDERLFWRHSEDHNHVTATLYDSLGLACYEAMEAFVEYKVQVGFFHLSECKQISSSEEEIFATHERQLVETDDLPQLEVGFKNIRAVSTRLQPFL